MRLRATFLTLIVATVLACGDSPAAIDPGQEPMATAMAWADSGAVRARIWFSLRNRTDRTLFLRTRCAIGVERRVADGWEEEHNPQACVLVLQSAIWLAPGEPYEDELSLHLNEGWQTGEFRLRFDQLTDELGDDEQTFGPPVPLELRVSAPFTIEAR